MIGNLRRHQSQRCQRISAADHAFVGHFGSHRVAAQAFGGGDDAFFNAAQTRVAVKLFALVADTVFVQTLFNGCLLYTSDAADE